ncbi:MAG: tetratricopeptide repeat protein [Lentimicrobiaceae bacterium]|nr:tetratricopeptide repeat protein [Lentimicrobiaceae bacterium]
MRKHFFSHLLFILFLALLVSVVSCTTKTRTESESDAVKNDSLSDQLTILNEAVARQPNSVNAWLNRARYFNEKELFNEALQDVNKALSIDENNVDVYLVLSDVYLYSGKTQRSLEALKKAKQLAPADADVDVKTARLYLTMSDYKQTFNSLREALKKDPQNAEAFFISGLANEEMGDTSKAIDSYQNAVARNQKHFDALKQLGIIFSIRHDKLAIDYLRNASQVNPRNSEPLYILGMYYQENNDPDKALSVYREIIQIDSVNKLAHYNTGYVLMVYKREYQKAAEAFSKALEIDPDYTDALYNRGYAYELMGDVKSARKDYERVLRMKVNDDKAIQGLNRLDNAG